MMPPQIDPGNYPLPFGQNYGPSASSYATAAYSGMPGLPLVPPYVPPYTLPVSENVPVVPVVNRSAAGMTASAPCSTASVEAAGASSNNNLPFPGVRSNNPNFQFMTKYDGTKKGLSAKNWINDLEQSRTLYNLFEQQMVPLARLLCTDQARDWADIQPEKQTWEEFKTAFLREYGEKNQDKLFFEMISFTQGDASVGQYATSMQRYFKQLDIKPQKQMEYFVRDLKMGLQESTFAGHPTDLADAIEIARKAEDMCAGLPDKQEEVGNEVRKLRTQMAEMLSLQRRNEPRPVFQTLPAYQNATVPGNVPMQQGGAVPRSNALATAAPGSQGAYRPPRCLRCDELGHQFHTCTNPPKYLFHTCCRFWRKHRDECPQKNRHQ